MKESFLQALDNLRANKLRSFLTMFGIMWGIVSIVVLSALGEGFQRGNDAREQTFDPLRRLRPLHGARLMRRPRRTRNVPLARESFSAPGWSVRREKRRVRSTSLVAIASALHDAEGDPLGRRARLPALGR